MEPKRAPSLLPLLFLTIFIDLVGFGILIPIIPLLLANPHSPFYLLPSTYSYETGLIILGFLVASFPIGQFFATPILGQLSDKYGRKKLLAFSLAGTSLSYVIFAFGIIWKSIPILFLARFFDGITGGNISVAQAAIADISAPKDRAKNFGLIGAAFGLGFILGPYIGGKLSDPTIVSWFSATTPFWFAAGLSFLNVLSIIFILPETLLLPDTSKQIDWSRSLTNIKKAFSLPGLKVLFATNFLFQGGFTFFTSFASVFFITRFGFTQGNIGDFFSYVGIWIVITQLLVTRFLAKRLREDQVLSWSLLLVGYSMLLYFAPRESIGIYFVAPFFAIFNGLSQANITSLVSRSAGREIQGEVLGINSSVMALAQSIPPILSGFIAAALTADMPIAVSGIVLVCSGFLFLALYRRPEESALAQSVAPAIAH